MFIGGAWAAAGLETTTAVTAANAKAVSKFFIFNLLEFKLSGLVIRSQPLLAGNLFEAAHKPSRKFKKLTKSPQDFRRDRGVSIPRYQARVRKLVHDERRRPNAE